MRFALILTGLLMLGACAGPDAGGGRSGIASDLAEPTIEPAPDAPVAAAPIAPAEICDDPGDGIGGTGCPVD